MVARKIRGFWSPKEDFLAGGCAGHCCSSRQNLDRGGVPLLVLVLLLLLSSFLRRRGRGGGRGRGKSLFGGEFLRPGPWTGEDPGTAAVPFHESRALRAYQSVACRRVCGHSPGGWIHPLHGASPRPGLQALYERRLPGEAPTQAICATTVLTAATARRSSISRSPTKEKQSGKLRSTEAAERPQQQSGVCATGTSH